MRKSDVIKLLCLLFLSLTGCSPQHSLIIHSELVNVDWSKKANINPNDWYRQGNYWFLKGDPIDPHDYLKKHPDWVFRQKPIRASQFTHLSIAGEFQVQLVGGQSQNSVYVIGPAEATRHIVVKSTDSTLCISEVYTKKETETLQRHGPIIVRVNIGNLKELSVVGPATVYGRYVISDGLRIKSQFARKILLRGQIRLISLNQMETEDIILWDTLATRAYITVIGRGNLNISGHVGLARLSHAGDGQVHIVGAHAKALAIYTGGNGLTTLLGPVQLSSVLAKGNSQLYLYPIQSDRLTATLYDGAKVGLAGSATILHLNAFQRAYFEGQYLRIQAGNAVTRGNAHASIASDKKIFVAAWDDSTIYFFGAANNISEGTLQGGMVVALPRHP